jgi:iron complex transport system substrate-binding protein
MIQFRLLSFWCLLLLLPACSQVYTQIAETDDLHRVVQLPSPARRIVSLAPSITESLFALGAGDQIVGVTDYCNFPEESRNKPRVGGMTNPSMEAIISLSPDLVILSMEGNIRENFDKVVTLGVPVFVTNPRTLEGIHRSIGQLGRLTGNTERAARLVKLLAHHEDSLRRRAPMRRTRTLFFVSVQPLIAVGRNTFLNELLERAGALNLAASAAVTFPLYSREAVVSDDPEIIIFMADVLPNENGLHALYPEWATLSAMKNHNVFRIDPDLVSRPGPRAVDGLETLVHILQSTRKQ